MKKIKKLSLITLTVLCIVFAGCSVDVGSDAKNTGAEEASSTEAYATEAQTEQNAAQELTSESEAQAEETAAPEEDNGDESETSSVQSGEEVTLSSGTSVTASFSPYSGGKLDVSDLFTDRDLLQTPDLSSAVYLTVSDGQTIDITSAGVYVLSGTATDCTVRVDAGDDDKVQIVLNGVSITNGSSPAIYVVNADKCFITTVEGTSNTLSVTGTFTADGDTNTDAVVFSKDDLVFNGLGALTISSTGNGISGKDDIKFTGGTYTVTSSGHAVEANDSVAFCGGTFTIKAGKDGVHAENDEDTSVGYVYIAGGSFSITASSDGIHATTVVQIDDGEITIGAPEGIEGTYVQINGGNITITASDDGINAGRKSSAYSVCIEFNGGYTKVSVGQGDTDAIDSNGDIIVNGGTIDVTSTMSSFDYDGSAQYNGGTIIINGETVNSIPSEMMGGMGGMMQGGMNGGFGGQGRRG